MVVGHRHLRLEGLSRDTKSSLSVAFQLRALRREHRQALGGTLKQQNIPITWIYQLQSGRGRSNSRDLRRIASLADRSEG
jgi:hypothetical protein